MNLLEQFVDFLANQKDKPSFLTVKNYKADIGQFISWFEKKLNLPFNPSKITPQILEQYKKSRNLSSTSIERHISSLRKFSTFLKIKGLIGFDLFAVQTIEKILPDPWQLKSFKNFLYEYKKSNLTIKNYINDIKSFFRWLSEVSLTKYAWDVAERNLLDKVNFSVIDEYKQRLVSSKFSPRTINRKLSSLRNYIKWAISQGFIKNFETDLQNTIEEIDKDPIQRPTATDQYSSFPPIRLAQKSLKGANFLFDNLFIFPIAKTIEETQYLLWRLSGKKIFTKSNQDANSKFLEVKSGLEIPISNIKKDFYAPLNVSLRYLPTHEKIWHYLRYVRPNWYKRYHSYSIVHYFHFAILFILTSAVGFGIYNGLFADVQKENAILGAATSAPPRILSFQGRLTDSSNNPITKDTSILFSIYNDENASGAASLWQETNAVKPDSDGVFSTFLGKNTPIPDTIFSQNPKLFLGITVGNSPELRPRQQLATVPFASNAETLQGLEPITNSTKVSNVVLALDSSGNLSIAGSKAHTFQAIGGQFVISGSVLSLTTIPGSNSRVEIVPDGVGKIDLSKPIQNSTNNNNLSSAIGSVEFDDNVAILATTSAQSAFYINQNSTGPLISASTSGTAKFTVDNDGTGTFAGSVGINGSSLTSTATTFNLLNSTVTTLNFAGAATNLVLGASTGTVTLRNASAVIQGNVGIGTAPLFKLDVQDSQSATATAQIYNTNSGTDADGLIVKLGNTSTTAVNANNHFVSFETSGIGIVGSIQGNGGKGITYATSGIADFAEYFKKYPTQTIEFGSVVCLEGNGSAVKCDNNRNKIIGVASQRPAFLGGENLGNGSIAVGLIGQVETLVTTMNGGIKAGDVLTASDIPGVSVKATKAGQIIGKALEDLSTIDDSKVVGFYDPDTKEYRSKDNFPDIPLKPNIIRVVKIHTLVNVSWYDPGAYVANTGDLIIHKTGSNGYSVSTSDQTLTNIGGFFEVVAANIKGGLINAKELITNTLILTSDSIIVNGQNIRDYIAGVVNELGIKNQESGIISPVASIDRLYTNIISPLGGSLIVRLATPSAQTDSSFIIQNSSGSAVARIDDQGNASFSGQLSSNVVTTNNVYTNGLQAGSASISGTLRASNIIANSIEGLDARISKLHNTNFIDIASYSAQLAYVAALQAERAQFNQGLMVFGATSLSDLSVSGQLSIGGTMFATQNSIETLGTDLSLQSLRQGGLSIMGGLVYIDTQGNIKVKGDLSIAGKLAVNIISPLPKSDLVINNASGSGVLSINQKGDIVASGSGTFAKLNFSLVEPALAISPTEFIASSSAGGAFISSYQDEVTIRNNLVTNKSVIYITPVGTPSAQSPFLMRQNPFESFTVGVESPTKNPIPFNWLIVN